MLLHPVAYLHQASPIHSLPDLLWLRCSRWQRRKYFDSLDWHHHWHVCYLDIDSTIVYFSKLAFNLSGLSYILKGHAMVGRSKRLVPAALCVPHTWEIVSCDDRRLALTAMASWSDVEILRSSCHEEHWSACVKYHRGLHLACCWGDLFMEGKVRVLLVKVISYRQHHKNTPSGPPCCNAALESMTANLISYRGWAISLGLGEKCKVVSNL